MYYVWDIDTIKMYLKYKITNYNFFYNIKYKIQNVFQLFSNTFN